VETDRLRMRHRHVLDPADVRDVARVAERVDVFVADRDPQPKGGTRFHVRFYTPSSWDARTIRASSRPNGCSRLAYRPSLDRPALARERSPRSSVARRTP